VREVIGSDGDTEGEKEEVRGQRETGRENWEEGGGYCLFRSGLGACGDGLGASVAASRFCRGDRRLVIREVALIWH